MSILSLTTKLFSTFLICENLLFFPPTSKSHFPSTTKSPYVGMLSWWATPVCEERVLKSLSIQQCINLISTAKIHFLLWKNKFYAAFLLLKVKNAVLPIISMRTNFAVLPSICGIYSHYRVICKLSIGFFCFLYTFLHDSVNFLWFSCLFHV